MSHSLHAALWLTLIALLPLSPARAAIVNSVDGVAEAPPSVPFLPPPLASGPGFIDFDDNPAPCLFSQTVALRDEYAALGVTFSGPGPLDGGAISDSCGNWYIGGFSPPNFLAFNSEATLSNGGVPVSPETITFTPEVTFVQIYVASYPGGGSVTLAAFDAGGGLLDSSTASLGPTLVRLSVSAPGIKRVVLSEYGQPRRFIADDLSFTFDPVAVGHTVEQSSWGRVKALFR